MLLEMDLKMDNTSFKISFSPVPASAYLRAGQELSVSRVSDILGSIINAPTKYQIISLASAYDGEGGPEIAYELASALAATGKRVLIVDGEAGDVGVYREFRYVIPNSINTVLQNSTANSYTVLNVQNTDVFYACFCKKVSERDAAYDADRFTSLFQSLKNAFDYILVISEENTGLSVTRATQISDASIVIVEAERTRRPVVAQLIESIKLNGGTILGLVLNKRPLYIPPMLYKLLYR